MSGVEWDRIPHNVMDEIKQVQHHTKKTNKEASITICKRENSYYVGGDEQGNEISTGVSECKTKFGTGEKVSDVHSHPVVDNRWGGSIIPSEADFTGYIEESYLHENKQIGCVTNHHVPYIQCVQPKTVPDKAKKNAYVKALDRQYATTKRKDKYVSFSDPYFQDNISKDFNFSFFDRDTGSKVKNPEAKKVIKCALGVSNRRFRHEVKVMEKSAFCNWVQSMTAPSDDRIGQACKEEIRTRNILGIIEY